MFSTIVSYRIRVFNDFTDNFLILFSRLYVVKWFRCIAQTSSMKWRDKYRERLFQHLSDPGSALSEMVRVSKSGGRIVVLDADWGTFSIDTPDIDIERRLSRFRTERGVHNCFAGRQLYRLFKQRLTDVEVELHPLMATNYAFVRETALLDETEQSALDANQVTEDELRRWYTGMPCQ